MRDARLVVWPIGVYSRWPAPQVTSHPSSPPRPSPSESISLCSGPQQNSSDRRAAGESDSSYQAVANTQDGRAVGTETKAKKCASERKLNVPCRVPSVENCVEHGAIEFGGDANHSDRLAIIPVQCRERTCTAQAIEARRCGRLGRLRPEPSTDGGGWRLQGAFQMIANLDLDSSYQF
jgi:hypothetical protein